ncbi:DUF6932 family protein [Cytobacillus firmus]|uniref:DUF6932 family protein n=1 Tax=Cytobacillus firmus TaxID=1399 RepID=UPI003688BD3A
MEFNEHGNLNGGIIKGMSLDDVEEFFVKNFPNSNTRERNFKGFTEFIEVLKRDGVVQVLSKIWLDGSFLTNKEDPNDIDMVIYLNPHEDNIEAIKDIMKNRTNIFHALGRQFHCDAYFSVDDDLIPESNVADKRHFDYQRKYWMGQFGFDREARNKGIVEILL